MENSIVSHSKVVFITPDYWESAETNELDKALVGFNSDFQPVPRDGVAQIEFKSGGGMTRKFATLSDIMKVVRPALAKNKLFVEQPIVGDRILTKVTHESGQFRCVAQPMLAWKGTNTNELQNLGGAITYLRRYALSAFLALATEEDDDGNSAGKAEVRKRQVSPTAPTPLEDHVVDAWQSKVNACNTPDDFTRLSTEVASLGFAKTDPVVLFIRAAITTRMAAMNVEFDPVSKEYRKKEARKEPPAEKQA